MVQQTKGRRSAALPPRQAEPAGMIGEMLGSPTFLNPKELGFVTNIDGYARLRGTITDDQGTAIRDIYAGFRGRLGKADGQRAVQTGTAGGKNG